MCVKRTRDKSLIAHAPLSIETSKSAFHANLRSYQLEGFRTVSQFCGFEIGTGTAGTRNSLSSKAAVSGSVEFPHRAFEYQRDRVAAISS